MPTTFSETLVKLRKEAGFPTAYRFFHDNGGDKVLGMCYRKYLMMEQGRILPQFKHLRAFIFGLRLESRGAGANNFAAAWLKTMAGEELFEEILAPMFAQRQPAVGLSPSQKALKEAIAGRKFHVTPAQLEAIAATPERYRCFMFLSNDTGVWTADKLAAAAGIKKPAAAKALKDFLAAKLLRPAGEGWRCPLAGALIEMPHSSSAAKCFEKIRYFQRDLIMAGIQTHRRYGIFRADEAALADLYPIMDQSVSSSHVYALHEKTPKSAMFLVEARAIKLADF
jgi:hypothetical protein